LKQHKLVVLKLDFFATGRHFVKTGYLLVTETALLPKSTIINVAQA